MTPAQSAGLPGSDGMVCVVPPKLPNGANIAFAVTILPFVPLLGHPDPVQSASLPLAVLPDTMLLTTVIVPALWIPAPLPLLVEFPATVLFVSVIVPPSIPEPPTCELFPEMVLLLTTSTS